MILNVWLLTTCSVSSDFLFMLWTNLNLFVLLWVKTIHFPCKCRSSILVILWFGLLFAGVVWLFIYCYRSLRCFLFLIFLSLSNFFCVWSILRYCRALYGFAGVVRKYPLHCEFKAMSASTIALFAIYLMCNFVYNIISWIDRYHRSCFMFVFNFDIIFTILLLLVLGILE